MQQTAQKQEAVFNLDDILDSATVSKTTKDKSKVPVITVDDKVKELVTEVRRLKAELDSAESMFKLREKELLDLVIPERERLCLNMGYVSSVKVPSVDNLSVRISWKDQYTKIGLETVPMIEGIIKDRFQQFFTTDMTITVKNNSQSALNELIQAIGPARFREFFEVQKIIKPSPRYTTEFFTAFNEEERQQLSLVVHQYKPAISTK